MRLNVDAYLDRRFDRLAMNCWHLVEDAWLELTGEVLGLRTAENMLRAAIAGTYDGEIPRFARLDSPADPCIVLMRSPGAIPHVGVYHKRRVLQMTQRGASFVPLATATSGYADVGFYR
jgi:hypothetical protein